MYFMKKVSPQKLTRLFKAQDERAKISFLKFKNFLTKINYGKR